MSSASARRPLRKEDRRFLTGRGNYVADIKRPDMVAGVFLRSPHAHAAIKSIDAAAALAMPGVLAVFTGEDLKAAGVGGAAVRLGHHRQGRIADERAAAPGAGPGQGAPCRRSCRLHRCARPASRRKAPPRQSWSTMRCCRRSSACSTPSSATRRCLFDDVPNNLCCDWALGDKAATDAAFRKAAHVARISLVNNRLVGNPMEPRAAIAEYNPATGHYTLVDDKPVSACRAPAHGRLRAQHPAAQAPRRRARCRRRFRRQAVPLCRGGGDHLGGGQGRAADQMGLRAQRRFHLRRARPRSRHRGRIGA